MSDGSSHADRALGEESAAEQARLGAELEALHERSRRAAEAKELTERRTRAAFVALTDTARAELASINVGHAEALARVRAAAEAEARSILAGTPAFASARGALDHQSDAR